MQRMGRTGRKRQGRVVQLVAAGHEENSYKRGNATKSRIYKVRVMAMNAAAAGVNIIPFT